jgi:hypothetical protein
MKASELVEKLKKLIEINPDANVYFYADDDTLEFVGNRYLKGNRLSDVGLVLSRSLENGEGLICIDMENTSVGTDKEDKENKKSKCEHEAVLEIYKDSTHKEISHYRCLQCGDKKNKPFGKNIVKSSMEARQLSLS